MFIGSEFDMIAFGASGVTGRLVAEYVFDRYAMGGEVTWAMAGPSLIKLTEV